MRLPRTWLLPVWGLLVPSRSEVDQLVDANRAVRELITDDLTAFWSSLDLAYPDIARDQLLEYIPVLVAQYGDITAVVAADWYTEVRRQASAPGKFSPVMAKNIEKQFIEKGVRSAAGALFTDKPETMLDRMIADVGKWAAQTGRNTIVQSAHRDPWKPRVARVPTGAETCAFCLVLASRGPIYTSLQTAGKWNKYHGKCDCQAVIIGPHQELPEGYDPNALYDQYLGARDEADSGSLPKILSAFREMNDVH